ncbi:MAG: tetratricopeptide repeat protein [Gammaproteobacteria bacterium]
MLAMFLSACSNVPMQVDEQAAVAKTSSEVSRESQQYTPPPPKRPDLELTEDILYKVLLAEIAGQRGRLDIAVENYLELARSTRDPVIADRATRVAVYARDDKSTMEAAQIWVELAPENPDAHQILAVMAVRQGDVEGALLHLEHILKNSDGQLNQKLWMIANLIGQEKDQEVVKEIMEQLMANHDDDPEALYAYAHVMSRMGDTDRSRELLEKVLILVPDNNNAVTSYVSILQKQGEINTAIEWLEQSLVTKEDDFNRRMIYARLLTDIRRFDDARKQFEILVVQTPDNVDVLYALGLLYLQDNHLDESEQYFQRLSEQGKRTDDVNYYLGRIAQEKGDYEKASTWYQSIQKGENYFDAQIRIGMLLAKQNKIEEARQHIKGISTQGAEQKNLLIQAEGELLVEEKRYQDALDVYDSALLNNYDPDLLYSRAMLAEKMDRLDILERDLLTILEKDPEHSQALNALGYTLADRTDRYEEAYKYIEKALQLSPNDFYVLDSMGWVMYRLGRLEEAIEYLKKALTVRKDPEIAAHLGEVLWVKGDKDSAQEIWDTALQETPEDDRLLDVINRFNP